MKVLKYQLKNPDLVLVIPGIGKFDNSNLTNEIAEKLLKENKEAYEQLLEKKEKSKTEENKVSKSKPQKNDVQA
jgi:hypothetical protein